MLSKEKISEQLGTKWAASNIWYKEVTGSTKDDAKRLAEEGAPHGMLVVADKQEQGRGSKGRSWETPAGRNIAMSMVLRPTVPLEAVPMITLVAGLSVAEGIDKCLIEAGAIIGGSEGFEKRSGDVVISQIKWPNDVIIGGKKICGILTETNMEPGGGVSDVILGIGINVNMTEFPEEISEFAGSILTASGMALDRNKLIARIMERFETNYELYEKSCDLSLLKDSYELRMVSKGEKVLLTDTNKVTALAGKQAVEESFESNPDMIGTAMGITDKGQLQMIMEDGRTCELNAGEISVRGLYGYV